MIHSASTRCKALNYKIRIFTGTFTFVDYETNNKDRLVKWLRTQDTQYYIDKTLDNEVQVYIFYYTRRSFLENKTMIESLL